MKLCVFSDVHGNRFFLEAFLNHVRTLGIDRFIFLGDSVSYYPWGNAVITRLLALGADCVEGNHDSMLRGEFPIPEQHEAVYRLRESMAEISAENLEFVRSWPEVRRETLDGRCVMFVHGSPRNHLKEYAYADSEMADYDDAELDVLFMGHTHRPWIRRNAHTLLVNVGSVGMPRDLGCSPSFALFDTVSGEVSLERITVDPAPLLSAAAGVHESVLRCLSR